MGNAIISEDLPSGRNYVCRVFFRIIPKVVVIIFSIIIAAFRAELYSASVIAQTTGNGDNRELPLDICFFVDGEDDVYGDRICNNAIASAIVSILIAMMLMVLDLYTPCIDDTFKRMARLLTLFWSVMLAAYWVITSALLVNLYERYCDSIGGNCEDIQEKFIILPVFGFVCMAAWIAQAIFSLIRLLIKREI